MVWPDNFPVTSKIAVCLSGAHFCSATRILFWTNESDGEEQPQKIQTEMRHNRHLTINGT
jgi:hypothetical protein